MPQGKTWSAPISTILSDVLRQGKKFPKPPFSFWFLVALYVCIGWSGLTYVTLNGPKLFEVHCRVTLANRITSYLSRIGIFYHSAWAVGSCTFGPTTA